MPWRGISSCKDPDHIVLLDCPCRMARKDPCLPLDVCLIIGEPFAGFVAEHHARRSRWITQEEALEVLRAEHERGHVHHAFFKDAMLGRFYAICNCCSCCCGAMQATRSGVPMLASSGYVARLAPELCAGCATCEGYCQFGAITFSDGKSAVDDAKCMGCGVCVSHCPSQRPFPGARSQPRRTAGTRPPDGGVRGLRAWLSGRDHMSSEKEKMLRGELYNAFDPQLVLERRRARDLLKELNESRDAEVEKRQGILATLFGSIGRNVWVEPPFYCDYGANITLGDNVYFNFNCVILDVTPVVIGSDVLFGPAVQIYAATHPLSYQERRTGRELGKPVRIGSDVWIGGAVVINPGVTIGPQSVIGSGSVVTQDVPAGVFAAGNPCKVIRELS